MKEKIYSLTNNKIWLAPLAGITDSAFRTICKECGVDVVVSEMISADGLIYNRERSLKYADFTEFQRPFGIQLFGSDPDKMAKGTEIILEKKPDFIDINMGCPVKKVVNRGAGSALMKVPDIAQKIIFEVKKILKGTKIPLSVKIRSGWDKSNMNAIDFSKKMEDSGADMICIHPRTKSQMFSGKSDWSLIKELKESISIPIIGNGDINSTQDMIDMFEQTKCDSVMVGRGILGKPWMFQVFKEYFRTGKITSTDISTKLNLIKRHFELSIRNKGEKRAIIEMRTHFSYYTKGLKGGAKVRKLINKSLEKNEILNAIELLYLSSHTPKNPTPRTQYQKPNTKNPTPKTQYPTNPL